MEVRKIWRYVHTTPKVKLTSSQESRLQVNAISHSIQNGTLSNDHPYLLYTGMCKQVTFASRWFFIHAKYLQSKSNHKTLWLFLSIYMTCTVIKNKKNKKIILDFVVVVTSIKNRVDFDKLEWDYLIAHIGVGILQLGGLRATLYWWDNKSMILRFFKLGWNMINSQSPTIVRFVGLSWALSHQNILLAVGSD